MFSIKNLIIQKESKNAVKQWHFNSKQTITLFFSFAIIFIIFLILAADYLSVRFYDKRLNEFKTNYSNVYNNLEILKRKLEVLDKQIYDIEQKDNAIRTYAGMPIIDKDIRKLGIGGSSIELNKFSDNLAPILNKELALLEVDLEKISRKVNLELSSYNTLYKKIQKNIQRINGIPSIRPVDGGYLNSTFGYRIDPIDNVKRFHHGQDITVKTGTPIHAPADGIIKRAYYAGGFGNHIKIQHASGYTTLYAHLSKINVKHGQKVKRGDIIGLTGNTGRSTAPHLHYEIHHNGEPQNPLDFFFSQAGE